MRRLASASFAALKRRPANRFLNCTRLFASSVRVGESAQSTKDLGGKAKPKAEPTPLSSCPENTILPGLNYLKAQEPVLAKKDEDYPSWLWTLLKPRPIPDDGPGGKGEKMRLRSANRQRIKEQNFLKTQ